MHFIWAPSLISPPILPLSSGPTQCLCAQCSLNPRLARSLGNLYGVDNMAESADDDTPTPSSSPSCAPPAASQIPLSPSLGLGFGYSPSDPRLPPSPSYHQEPSNKPSDRPVRPRGPAFSMGPRGPAGPRRAPVRSGLTGRYLSRSIPVSLPMCCLSAVTLCLLILPVLHVYLSVPHCFLAVTYRQLPITWFVYLSVQRQLCLL